jgi:hypothetical protein
MSGPRIRSQAYVRIRKLVQNGMTSSRMRRLFLRPARVARKYASGRATRRHATVPRIAIWRLSTNGSDFWIART